MRKGKIIGDRGTKRKIEWPNLRINEQKNRNKTAAKTKNKTKFTMSKSRKEISYTQWQSLLPLKH